MPGTPYKRKQLNLIIIQGTHPDHPELTRQWMTHIGAAAHPVCTMARQGIRPCVRHHTANAQ
jgi:hypothetical protein